jgi:hypothetical protein
MLPCSTKGTVSKRWGEKMRIKRIDIPASPAQMGIPEIKSANALPNKRNARTSSFIVGSPFNFVDAQ